MKRVVRSRALWAAVLYAALAVAFVSPALMPGKVLSASDYLYTAVPWEAERPADVEFLGSNFELADQTLQFEPFMRYTDEALPDMPLWNPHVMAGRPFHANSQSAIFSPFTIPAYLGGVPDALVWIVALKLFVAAFGAYLLGRALRMRFEGALLCGLVYGFGLFFVSWVTWPLASVWAWMPWLFALTAVVVRRPEPLPACGLAAIVAVQFFGGHPESSFHVLAATAAFFLLCLWRRRGKPLAPSVLAFVAAVAGGALLASVALVPLAELILNSGELSERTESAPDKISPRFLMTALLADFWGRPTQVPLEAFVHARAFYVGALSLMLAALAVVLRPTLERIAFAAFGLVAIAVVVAIPPFHQIVNALPVFSTAHNGRLVIYWALAAAVLAGFALGDLAERRPTGNARRVAVAVPFALAVAPAVWLAFGRPGLSDVTPALETAWTFVDPPREKDVIRLASLFVWLPFALAGAVLVSLRIRGRLTGRTFGTLAIALVVADLFRIGVGLNPAIDSENARVPATGAIEYLQGRRPDRFLAASKIGETPPLTPNTAMDFDLFDARGYDYPTEKRFSKMWKRAVFREEVFVPQIQAPVNAQSMKVFNLLAVRDIVAPPSGPPLEEPGLRLAYEGADARVYSNAGAARRAFVVGSGRVVDGEDDALDAVLAADFDPRREAILEEPVAALSDRPLSPGAAGSARIVEQERERVEIEATATRPGLLVLADVDYPGWKATVDTHGGTGGDEVPIKRVDYLLRGVPLEPGSHRIEFRYEPVSWRIGWITSLAAFVVLLMVVALSTASRRKNGRARVPADGHEARARS